MFIFLTDTAKRSAAGLVGPNGRPPSIELPLDTVLDKRPYSESDDTHQQCGSPTKSECVGGGGVWGGEWMTM